MRILVTNDDGIFAHGLAALTEAVTEFGEVFVVAPDRERSGAGHSLTLHRPLRMARRGENKYAVDGTPTDCIYLSMHELLSDQKPQLVVSGINHGANLGDDVTYSGTVSAALEATLLGIPSVAFSLCGSALGKNNFEPAKAFAKKMVKSIAENGMPKGTLLNVNVPNVAGSPDMSHEITHLGSGRYKGMTVDKLDPRGKKYYWIGGDELELKEDEGTDCNAIRQGKISVTPLSVDMTHYSFIDDLKQWKF